MLEEHESADQHEIAAPIPTQPSPLQAQPRTGGGSILFGADGLRAGWSILLFALILSALLAPIALLFVHNQHKHPTAAAAHATRQQDISISATLSQDGVLFTTLLLASFIMSRIERRPLATYGLGTTPGALRQFLVGLGWGVLFLSLLILALTAAHLLVFDGRLLSGTATLRYAFEWAAGFLCVALAEEYLLRGFLLFTLARGLSGLFALTLKTPHRDALGFWTAAVLLASVFGLGHGSNPGESPIGLVSAGLAALVFSLSLWRTGSLWWAIGFHAAWDWAQSFLYGVADSGMLMQHHLFASHPVGKPLLSGGLTGPEGSLFVVPILALASVVIWITLPQTTPAPPFTLHRLGLRDRSSAS